VEIIIVQIADVNLCGLAITANGKVYGKVGLKVLTYQAAKN
jgi:hypothetical protein